jgi:hypothetical protein
VRRPRRGPGRPTLRSFLLAAAGAVVLLALGCGPNLRGTVGAERLRPVVERDVVRLDEGARTHELLERLAGIDVLLIGEYHGFEEHDAFVGELVAGLYDHGFRSLLLEYPQAYSWLIDGYARGYLDNPGEGAARTYGTLLQRVRSLNATLPPEAHLRVRAIDVNARDDDFLPPFRGLLHQLGRPPLLVAALEAMETGRDRGEALASLEDALRGAEDELRGAWGGSAFDAVRDMVDGERRSLAVRRERAGRRRDEAREAAMKALVDRQLARAGGGTLVNVGYYHAQKTRRDGTVREWLGEHLVRSSPHAQGRTFVLVVVPARGSMTVSGRERDFDVVTDSPANELLRLVCEASGDAAAFLALDDRLFHDERVVVNYLPRIDTGPPAAVFDGFVVLNDIAPPQR